MDGERGGRDERASAALAVAEDAATGVEGGALVRAEVVLVAELTGAGRAPGGAAVAGVGSVVVAHTVVGGCKVFGEVYGAINGLNVIYEIVAIGAEEGLRVLCKILGEPCP